MMRRRRFPRRLTGPTSREGSALASDCIVSVLRVHGRLAAFLSAGGGCTGSWQGGVGRVHAVDQTVGSGVTIVCETALTVLVVPPAVGFREDSIQRRSVDLLGPPVASPPDKSLSLFEISSVVVCRECRGVESHGFINCQERWVLTPFPCRCNAHS